jgi:hypothetical protein
MSVQMNLDIVSHNPRIGDCVLESMIIGEKGASQMYVHPETCVRVASARPNQSH